MLFCTVAFRLIHTPIRKFVQERSRAPGTASFDSLIFPANDSSDRLNGAEKVSFNGTLADPHDSGDFDHRQIMSEPESKSG